MSNLRIVRTNGKTLVKGYIILKIQALRGLLCVAQIQFMIQDFLQIIAEYGRVTGGEIFGSIQPALVRTLLHSFHHLQNFLAA